MLTFACVFITLSVSSVNQAFAQDDFEKQRRQPDGGHHLHVSLHVPYSALDIKSGPDADYSGTVWVERLMGRNYRGKTSVRIESRAGSTLALPNVEFQTDADYDPKGEAESYTAGIPDSVYLHRLFATSDFGLLPIRAILSHAMPYGGRSRDASKSVSVTGAAVEMHEKDSGIKKVGAFPLTRYFYRGVRRFQPSGWEMHDYIYSVEDKGDETVYFSCGLRLLVHPTATLPDGTRPESGVFHVVSFSAVYLDWFGADFERPDESDKLIKNRDRLSLHDRYKSELQNALYDALNDQGLGDPFDSPATFAMQHADLIDAQLVKRLLNLGSPKVLAQVSPALVDADVEFDGATYKKLWKTADDPAERLLLAAGAAKGGAKDKGFATECRLAAGSKDATVRRAALVLAKALGDQALIQKAGG